MKLWTNGTSYALQDDSSAMGSSAWDCVRVLLLLPRGSHEVIELDNFNSKKSKDGKWKIISTFKDVDYVAKRKPCVTCGRSHE
jgi:hypothetical protein